MRDDLRPESYRGNCGSCKHAAIRGCGPPWCIPSDGNRTLYCIPEARRGDEITVYGGSYVELVVDLECVEAAKVGEDNGCDEWEAVDLYDDQPVIMSPGEYRSRKAMLEEENLAHKKACRAYKWRLSFWRTLFFWNRP